MNSVKLACIVCTKDRPEDIRNLFVSFEKQTRKPDQIIVVDGSDNPIKHVLDGFPSLKIDYITVRPPGLAKQRNAGIKELRPDIHWVGFMDDDLVLEEDCLKNLEIFPVTDAGFAADARRCGFFLRRFSQISTHACFASSLLSLLSSC